MAYTCLPICMHEAGDESTMFCLYNLCTLFGFEATTATSVDASV